VAPAGKYFVSIGGVPFSAKPCSYAYSIPVEVNVVEPLFTSTFLGQEANSFQPGQNPSIAVNIL